MPKKEAIDLVEEVFEFAILVNASDLRELADLHTHLEELTEAVAGPSFEPEIARVTAEAANQIELAILDEGATTEEALQATTGLLECLQKVLRDGVAPREVSFPALLLGALKATSPGGPTEQADATPTQDQAAPAPEATGFEGDPELIGDFVIEAKEHLENADVQLLALEDDPKNEEAINGVFRAFHTLKGSSSFLGLLDIQMVAHEAENLLDKARSGELSLVKQVMDVAFDSVDALKGLVELAADSLNTGEPVERQDGLQQLLERIRTSMASEDLSDIPPAASKRLGEILVDTGRADPEVVEEALEEQRDQTDQADGPKVGEILVRSGKVKPKDVAQALRDQKRAGTRMREPVKVDSERLDYLVDAIGELVIAESMASQALSQRGLVPPDVKRHLNQLDKITHDLQRVATSLRMVPVRSVFQKMARLARDLGRKFEKEIEFVIVGEETELDKSVVDIIGDPLVHMVRNSIDHGLEASAEERIKAGKPPVGRVELCAFHQGGSIHIEIKDDGRGLNREAILKKGCERGLVDDPETITDSEIWNLVFQPGFSTAEKVTEVSGRGVGLDVVRRNIENLRGQVNIESTPGEGSVFSIRLPLTLAIIDGMVVRVGKERYTLPTLSITQLIRPSQEDITTVVGSGEMLSLHGSLVPLFRLSRLFETPEAIEEITEAVVVIVEHGGDRVGLLVDEVLGQQQTVIKTLGESMRGIPGISGGAIMPDGEIGLILDVKGIIDLSHFDTHSLPFDSGDAELQQPA